MDDFQRFSDLPKPLRRAIFAAAWRSAASGRGSSSRSRLRLVCCDARAGADAAITKVGVQAGEQDLTQLYACICAVGSGRFPALRQWRVQMSPLLPADPALREWRHQMTPLVPADDAIIALARAIPPILHKLHIQGASFGQPAAAALAGSAAMPALRQLVFRENGLDAAALHALAQGFGLRLELLDLSHNPLQVQGAAVLAGISSARLSALRELNLCKSKLNNAGVQALTLVAWPALEILHLDENDISREGAAALADASSARLPALRELSLSANMLGLPDEFGNSGVQALMQAAWGALEILRLDRNWVRYAGALALADAAAGRLPALRVLSLCRSEMGDMGLGALVGKTWAALEILNLEGNNISHAGVEALTNASVARLPALRRLHLGSNNVGDAGVACLARRTWPHLQELHLQSNGFGEGHIGSYGAHALGAAGAQRFPALQTLSLARNRMWGEGVCALVQQAPWPALRSLDVSGNAVQVEGMAALAAASRSQLPALRALTLGDGDQVCRAAIGALAQGDWRHLEALNFCAPRYRRTPNVSGGVDALVAAGAARFPALRSLTLEKIPVSEEQEAALAAAWPGASIILRRPDPLKPLLSLLPGAYYRYIACLVAALLFCSFMRAAGAPAPLLVLTHPAVLLSLLLLLLISLQLGLIIACIEA